MKKFFSYLFAASTACTFSFRKMEQSGVFKGYKDSKNCYTFISNIERMDEETFNTLYRIMDPQGKEIYYTYLYDKTSKFGFINMSNADEFTIFQTAKALCDKITFTILRRNTYPNIEKAKESFGLLACDPQEFQFLLNIPGYENCRNITEALSQFFEPEAFFIDTDQEPEAVRGVKYLIEKNREDNCNPLHKFRVNDFKWSTEYTSTSGIKVNNTIEGVKLTKTLKDGEEKTIDFQESLRKYLKKQSSLGDSFAQPLVQLISEVKIQHQEDQKSTNEKTIIDGSLVREIVNKSYKIISIEKQLDLLNNSEILAIWHLLPSQEITESDEPSGKTVNKTIIGVAIDKETKTTFHYVTDLDRDIEQLFED